MEYKMFTKKIKKSVQRLFGDGYEVDIKIVLGTNGEKKEALYIIKTGEREQISPVFYLQSYYEYYQSTGNVEICAGKIYCIYHEQKGGEKSESINLVFDWDLIKDDIFPILLWKEKNLELLTSLVHREVLDLAVCYVIRNVGPTTENNYIKISKDLVEKWGIQEETIHEQAIENLKHDSYHIRSITSLIRETEIQESKECCINEWEDDMYVLTNKEKLYGAAGLLLGREYFDKVLGGKSVYIIPSSIHELILVRDCNKWRPEQLNDMVKEVNEEQVLLEERLSDHVYYYNAETGNIEI